MSSILQQTLRGLCFDTGWCYAVFWKLKQRPRTVLTWEDAFYERKSGGVNVDSSVTTIAGFGQQICGQLTDMEDQIALAVSKMSYHVYSVGEGIIGRVAFTNKHQWVLSYSKKGTVADGLPSRKANQRMQPEKYPTGWEHQFASGIKTIAVIAVPQGVVQLGSTLSIAEDLKLIGHVKALFGTLQTVPGAFLSDLVSEVQKGGSHTGYPLALPATQLPSQDSVLLNVRSPSTPSIPSNGSLAAASAAAFNSRLPMILASQQLVRHAHSMPLPPVLGFQEAVPHFQHSFSDKPGLESRSQSSFPFFKPLCTWAALDKVGISPQPGIEKPPHITTSTVSTCGVNVNPPSRTGITRHLSLSSKVSVTALPFSEFPSPSGGHCFSADASHTRGKGVSLPSLDVSEDSGAHGLGKPVARMGSPQPVGGNPVAAGVSDVSSSIRIQKASTRTTKENLPDVSGKCELGNIPSMGCRGLVDSVKFVGARAAGAQPVALGRVSAESLQTESGGHVHFAKHQHLDSIRSSSESRQLDSNAGIVKAGKLDWDISVSRKRHGLVETPLAGESQWLVSPSPLAESSQCDVERDSIQTGQFLDKHRHFSLQSGQFGGANSANEHRKFASERSSVESFQPGDNTLSISTPSNFSGGLSINTFSTVNQESCTSECAVASTETSTVHCEQNWQTVASDSGQMSDLFQLAKEFENADRDDPKDLLGDKADLQQGISSGVLCDTYFEDLQSSKPLYQNLEVNSGDFCSSPYNSVETFFTNELDDFENFFSSLTKVEESKSEVWPHFMSETESQVSASCRSEGITRERSQFGKTACGSKAISYPLATSQGECEPTFCTLDADQPFSNCFVSEVTLPCNDFPSIQSEPQFEKFVNSRIQPQVPVPCFRRTDGDKELGCQEITALPSRLLKTVKTGKKRSLPGEDRRVCLSKDSRQRIEDHIRKLRTIVPDGAQCSIDALLDKTVEHLEILQSKSQDPIQSAPLQSQDGGNDLGVEATAVNASWVMDTTAHESFCPIIVENLSQPGHMLVEMLCEENESFLQVADTIKNLGFTILNGVMEARNNQLLARFVTEGPRDVHRIGVLWSLMQLLVSRKPR